MMYFPFIFVPFLLGVESNFYWGTATAAYQVEGYRNADARQASIWDAFDTENVSTYILAKRPDGNSRIYNSENGAIADEDFVRYQESVDLTTNLGFQAIRLSLSWPRIVSYDKNGLNFTINSKGIAHYHQVLEAYAAKNIKVALTLWHWDLPLALEERAARDNDCASAWLCPWLPEEFEKYAAIVFAQLPAVEYYVTINEPLTIIQNGYSGSGPHAPGRCSDRSACYAGDDRLEPYAAAKTLILAHAHIFQAWKNAGRPGNGCGITLNGDYCLAFTKNDQDAATRCLEWQLPLFFDPIFYGHWPQSINQVVASRFSAEEMNATSFFNNASWVWSQDELKLVHGSHDGTHLFMNTYTSKFARAVMPQDPCANNTQGSFTCDMNATVSGYNFTDHSPIGVPSSNGWLFSYGAGIRKLLEFYNSRYPNRTFIITENGWGNATQSNAEVDLKDIERCNFYRDYISNVSAAAIYDNIKIAAYFAWSLIDNFEWADGYSTRFGLVYVNYTDQTRSAKHSALYFQKFITKASNLNQTPLPSNL